jgi:hypothetical protein
VSDEASQLDERYAGKCSSVEVSPRWDDVDSLELAILSHPLLEATKRHFKEMA